VDLTPAQVERLEGLLRNGFRFVTLDRYERFLGVVLLDPNEGNLKLFSQAGYRLGDGIGMLVEREGGRAFVWHEQVVPATTEMLETYQRFRAEIERVLKRQSQQDAP